MTHTWSSEPDIEQMITHVKWLSNAALKRIPIQNQFRALQMDIKNIQPWLADLKVEYYVLKEKAEKLDAIETLMREQSFIQINTNNQYSIQPRLSYKGTEIVSAIMAILFPDEGDS